MLVQKKTCGGDLLLTCDFICSVLIKCLQHITCRDGWMNHYPCFLEKNWSSCHLLLTFQADFFQAIFHSSSVLFHSVFSQIHAACCLKYLVNNKILGQGITPLFYTHRPVKQRVFFSLAVGSLFKKKQKTKNYMVPLSILQLCLIFLAISFF